MSKSTNRPIDYTALRDLVMARPYTDKLALVRELEKDIFANRFAELLERIRSHNDNGSINESKISEEVNLVRTIRYSDRVK